MTVNTYMYVCSSFRNYWTDGDYGQLQMTNIAVRLRKSSCVGYFDTL